MCIRECVCYIYFSSHTFYFFCTSACWHFATIYPKRKKMAQRSQGVRSPLICLWREVLRGPRQWCQQRPWQWGTCLPTIFLHCVWVTRLRSIFMRFLVMKPSFNFQKRYSYVSTSDMVGRVRGLVQVSAECVRGGGRNRKQGAENPARGNDNVIQSRRKNVKYITLHYSKLHFFRIKY